MIEKRVSFLKNRDSFIKNEMNLKKSFSSPVLLLLNVVYADHVTTRNEESENNLVVRAHVPFGQHQDDTKTRSLDTKSVFRCWQIDTSALGTN